MGQDLNLTLLGKEPDQRTLEYIIKDKPEKEMHKRIASLFTPQGYPQSVFKSGFYTHSWGDVHFASEAILDSLRGLPANHKVVEEILNQTSIILLNVSKMSTLELRTITHQPNIRTCQTPIVNAFLVGNCFYPESIFNNLQRAAYHIINLHIPIQKNCHTRNQFLTL